MPPKFFYVCSICSRNYVAKKHLDQHYKLHFSQPLHCNICNKAYKTKTSLTRHQKIHGIENKKNKKTTWPCKKCSKVFLYRQNLYRHRHTHLAAHICTTCNKSFQSSDVLQSHIIDSCSNIRQIIKYSSSTGCVVLIILHNPKQQVFGVRISPDYNVWRVLLTEEI